ncbi:CheY-like receiver domain-containing protein [Opitutaceae bacterium TAV1]|nr:CheY-like receiver domain-containing protein [Opitutaceae bacterium TAV1]
MKKPTERKIVVTGRGTPPLRLLYVESHWLARKTVGYLMQDVECEWSYADDAAQAVALVGKTGEPPFGVIIVDHHQTAEGSGLRVVRALREAGYAGTILAVGVEEISGIERQRYEKFDVPFLVLTPENHIDLKTAVREAVRR